MSADINSVKILREYNEWLRGGDMYQSDPKDVSEAIDNICDEVERLREREPEKTMENKMQVHVICCNDSLEFAVIGDKEQAKEKMAELSESYFDSNKGIFKDKAEYKINYYWHIRTVPGNYHCMGAVA